MKKRSPDTTLTPSPLLDAVKRELGLTNDRDLAHRLCFTPSQVSRSRNGKAAISDEMLLAIHEQDPVKFTIPYIKRLRDNRVVWNGQA